MFTTSQNVPNYCQILQTKTWSNMSKKITGRAAMS